MMIQCAVHDSVFRTPYRIWCTVCRLDHEKKCRWRLCFFAGFLGWKSSPQGDGRTAQHVREEAIKEEETFPDLLAGPVCLTSGFLSNHQLLAPLPSNNHIKEESTFALLVLSLYVFPDVLASDRHQLHGTEKKDETLAGKRS